MRANQLRKAECGAWGSTLLSFRKIVGVPTLHSRLLSKGQFTNEPSKHDLVYIPNRVLTVIAYFSASYREAFREREYALVPAWVYIPKQEGCWQYDFKNTSS